MRLPWDGEKTPLTDKCYHDPNPCTKYDRMRKHAADMERRARHAEEQLRIMYLDTIDDPEVDAHFAAAAVADSAVQKDTNG